MDANIITIRDILSSAGHASVGKTMSLGGRVVDCVATDTRKREGIEVGE